MNPQTAAPCTEGSKTRALHLKWAHRLWQQILQPGDIAVDATVGRGNDTLQLCHLCLLDNAGAVFGMDIQQQAIESTTDLLALKLSAAKRARVQLFTDSHAHIASLVPLRTAKLVIYNLGYLPGSDHAIITRCDSTLISMQSALRVLKPGGAFSVMCYPGHPGGAEECAACYAFFKKLAAQDWQVQCIRTSLREKSPILIWAQQLS